MPGPSKKEESVFWLRVKPRSRQDAIMGWDKEGYLEIHLKALPQRGEANRSCRQELSRALKVPRSHVHLEKGQTSGHKKIRVEGLSMETVRRRIDKVIASEHS